MRKRIAVDRLAEKAGTSSIRGRPDAKTPEANLGGFLPLSQAAGIDADWPDQERRLRQRPHPVFAPVGTNIPQLPGLQRLWLAWRSASP